MSEKPNFFKRIFKFFKSKWVWTIVVIIAVSSGYWFFFIRSVPVYQFITVNRGLITETVSIAGNTTPIQSVSLGFQNSGTVNKVYYDVGQNVSKGAVVAALNTSDLNAQLSQAKAKVDAETAKLNGLIAGSRPEDIAASSAAAKKAGQDLANMYGSVPNILNDGYTKANDAVRVQLSVFFSNAETGQPQLTFQTGNSQASINAVALRVPASKSLNDWQSEIVSLNSGTSTSTLLSLLQNDIERLITIRNLINNVSDTLNNTTNLSTADVAIYKNNVTAAMAEVNTAITNLNTSYQNISSQNLTVQGLEAQLALKKAGSTAADIDAQKAVVLQAKASVQSVEAKLQDSKIISPISGVVTKQDAKVGQSAAPGSLLVSIMSDGLFEVAAEIPETDIGKVAVGNPVSIDFDAFPGENFSGKVFYINPAETINQGVVDYKVKVSFDKPDPRIKSGLTANLDIKTKQKDNVLILPQYAVLENDQGTFVEQIINNQSTTTPVTLGIQDNKGNVEILSGVYDGEQVLNIGLKK